MPITVITVDWNSLTDRLGGGRIFALLDACDEPAVQKQLPSFDSRVQCLYSGTAFRDYWAIAPYILDANAEDVAWIRSELKARPWGFLAFAFVDLDHARRHFKRFLQARLPSGGKVFFRFYDPRILSTFLKTCTDEELKAFFGPFETLAVDAGEGLNLYTLIL